MAHVYLDWNVFDRIEKKESFDAEQKAIYNKIEELILEGKIICPYSNAHINDLLRGYFKNPEFIPTHLETLQRLTNGLSVVQYWGNSNVAWRYRNLQEFFSEALEEKKNVAPSFTKLLDFEELPSFDHIYEAMRKTPIPSNFKELYKANSVFSLLFPRTKTEMNELSLAEDLYDFAINSNKDYSIYKALRTYVNQSSAKLKSKKAIIGIEKSIGTPTYLNLVEAWEKHAPKTKTSDNPAYDKIINTYCKLDFVGVKSDDKFENMIDDALHVFYGAHCNYFVTRDEKCHYKASETYHKLGIETRALKPSEFVYNISLLLK
jgi:hypothetical protein